MKTEGSIQKEVYSLLGKIPFNQISVNLICKNLNITRQAFYYHYQNIFDVIYDIYLSNPINNNDNVSIYDVFNNIIEYLNKNKNFHKLIYESDSKEILIDIVNSYLYKFLINYLNKFKFNEDKKKSISRIYSYGISNELLFLYFSLDDPSNLIKMMCTILNDDVINKIKKD